MSQYDFDYNSVHDAREKGQTWVRIADVYGCAPSTVRKWYERQGTEPVRDPGWPEEPGTPNETDPVTLTRDDISRIVSLDDLLAFFKVDTEAWMVDNFKVNKWEQHSNAKGITPLYQVRANLRRNVVRDAKIAREAIEAALADLREQAPTPAAPDWAATPGDVLYEIALMDPHLGMLAWHQETGNDYDIDIATRDYRQAAEHLIALGRDHYLPDRILLVVGNDTLHIDTLLEGKVGATTRGTPQDFDTRLPKLFTEARRAIVGAIDMAREVAPVDVMVVSGNHDEHSMYKLGEVLSAWYRNDDAVNVLNEPTLRKYYQYGANLLGFTHGQEFRRKREPLALIMLDEAARQGIDLSAVDYREWHVGHFHATAELEHMSPRANLSETRGIRIRALPGLTASDAWHTSQGYYHHRAATALAFSAEGGLVGLHEWHPR